MVINLVFSNLISTNATACNTLLKGYTTRRHTCNRYKNI